MILMTIPDGDLKMISNAGVLDSKKQDVSAHRVPFTYRSVICSRVEEWIEGTPRARSVPGSNSFDKEKITA
jgi:hypothetical protein